MGFFSRLFQTIGGEGNTVRQSAGGSLGGEFRLITLPTKQPLFQETFADRLDYACRKHNATYERKRDNDTVIIRILLPDESVVSGRGFTTAAAVVEVLDKLEKVTA